MASLTHIEKRILEDLFGMSGGYVLDFSDRTFSSFFYDVVKVDIGDNKYRGYGDSKAKRLRAFWDQEGDQLVGKVLKELLVVWTISNGNGQTKDNEKYKLAEKAVFRLLGIQKLQEVSEEDFLEKDFGNISIKELKIEAGLIPVITQRIDEIQNCFKTKQGSPLSAIILTGSVLEGLLLSVAISDPAKFNTSSKSPKDKTGQVRQFQEWNLATFIDVAHDVGIIKIDVKKFSHVLRDFRNYIHPYHQMASNFNPDDHTAKICLQVLKAAIADLSGKR